MATQTITELLDDTDGTRATETVSFGLDGVEYEIDLSAGNAQALREALAPWQTSARRLTRHGAAQVQVSTGVDTQAVRAWAASNGVALPARGRIPAAVVEQFRAAGN